MRIAFTTLGCKINQFETDELRQNLEGRGNITVPFTQDADVYIINTCSVTAKSGQARIPYRPHRIGFCLRVETRSGGHLRPSAAAAHVANLYPEYR